MMATVPVHELVELSYRIQTNVSFHRMDVGQICRKPMSAVNLL
jgi:hypothetical protein